MVPRAHSPRANPCLKGKGWETRYEGTRAETPHRKCDAKRADRGGREKPACGLRNAQMPERSRTRQEWQRPRWRGRNVGSIRQACRGVKRALAVINPDSPRGAFEKQATWTTAACQPRGRFALAVRPLASSARPPTYSKPTSVYVGFSRHAAGGAEWRPVRGKAGRSIGRRRACRPSRPDKQ